MAFFYKKASELRVGDVIKKGRDTQRVKEVVVGAHAVHLVLSIVGKRVHRPTDNFCTIVGEENE